MNVKKVYIIWNELNSNIHKIFTNKPLADLYLRTLSDPELIYELGTPEEYKVEQ